MSRARTVCNQPGCPTLTNAGRCAHHTRQADQARGTKAARGYGTPYDRARRGWQRRLTAGEPINCWRCGQPINPQHWHLGHDDHNRNIIRGPEHPNCNLTAAGKKRHRK